MWRKWKCNECEDLFLLNQSTLKTLKNVEKVFSKDSSDMKKADFLIRVWKYDWGPLKADWIIRFLMMHLIANQSNESSTDSYVKKTSIFKKRANVGGRWQCDKWKDWNETGKIFAEKVFVIS